MRCPRVCMALNQCRHRFCAPSFLRSSSPTTRVSMDSLDEPTSAPPTVHLHSLSLIMQKAKSRSLVLAVFSLGSFIQNQF